MPLSIVSTLMSGQGMTQEEAVDAKAEMRRAVLQGQNPEEVLYENGLEPDYIFEIMP